jgi:hypothetical protein
MTGVGHTLMRLLQAGGLDELRTEERRHVFAAPSAIYRLRFGLDLRSNLSGPDASNSDGSLSHLIGCFRVAP